MSKTYKVTNNLNGSCMCIRAANEKEAAQIFKEQVTLFVEGVRNKEFLEHLFSKLSVQALDPEKEILLRQGAK